ncbi:MAG: hypothetical protein WAK01_13275 [Methylocystis sp.]
MTLYVDDGRLVYEYNMMIIERYIGRSQEKLSADSARLLPRQSPAQPGNPAHESK